MVYGFRTQLADLAVQRRLPGIYGSSLYADAGPLVYGANVLDIWRRAPSIVDKILRGTRPADIPVEVPTKFDFVVNLKMAQALGLTIPPPVLQQATEPVQ
jgi:putative ABC transport system substrate-binding protein